jgi:hypothetical protein
MQCQMRNDALTVEGGKVVLNISRNTTIEALEASVHASTN